MNQETKDTPIIKQSFSETVKQTIKPMTDYLNRQVNNRSTRTKKVGLLLFGVITSGICFLLIAQSLRTTTKLPNQSHDKITLPKKITPEVESPEKPMTEVEIIRKYNSYIDSLNANTKN